MGLWRVRATVVDKPGFLAVLAASLALRSVNILAVGVHITEQGAVDDFLVDAPDQLTAEQLLAAVERGRGRDAWVGRAEVRDLVDAPTRALDLATLLVREPAAVGTALAELLDAETSWHEVSRQPAADQHQFGSCGTRMWVPAPGGGAWQVRRAAPDFTPAEYARVQALLTLAAAVGQGDPVAQTLLLPGGEELWLRPATPADQAAVRAMHARCSPASLYRRYLSGAEPTEAQLARLLAPARGSTLLALNRRSVVGVATLVGEGVQAEVGLLVEDGWQRRGIGTALLRRTLALATSTGFDAVVVHTQADNHALLAALRRLDALGHTERDSSLVTVTVPLASLARASEACPPAGPA